MPGRHGNASKPMEKKNVDGSEILSSNMKIRIRTICMPNTCRIHFPSKCIQFRSLNCYCNFHLNFAFLMQQENYAEKALAPKIGLPPVGEGDFSHKDCM